MNRGILDRVKNDNLYIKNKKKHSLIMKNNMVVPEKFNRDHHHSYTQTNFHSLPNAYGFRPIPHKSANFTDTTSKTFLSHYFNVSQNSKG